MLHTYIYLCSGKTDEYYHHLWSIFKNLICNIEKKPPQRSSPAMMGAYKELEDIIQKKELGNGGLHSSWMMGDTD